MYKFCTRKFNSHSADPAIPVTKPNHSKLNDMSQLTRYPLGVKIASVYKFNHSGLEK